MKNFIIPDTIYGYKTYLEWIVEYGNLDILKCFVDNGYDLRRYNHEGQSQLHCFYRTVANVGVARSIDKNPTRRNLEDLVDMGLFITKRCGLDNCEKIKKAGGQNVEEYIKGMYHEHHKTPALHVLENVKKIIIKDSQREIQKNARILFCIRGKLPLPMEVCVIISSLAGNNNVHNEAQSEKLAIKAIP